MGRRKKNGSQRKNGKSGKNNNNNNNKSSSGKADGGEDGGRALSAQERKRAERARRAEEKRKRNKARYARDESAYSANFLKLAAQVATLGLGITDVASDGNCLFRAASDQLYGDVGEHKAMRAAVMDHVEANQELYQWFVEDDEPFDEYVAYMRENRSWGGQIEIQALSMVYSVNIIIHRLNEPRWTISNWPPGTRTIHLSYHDQQHYASVRPAGVPHGPFDPIDPDALISGSAKSVDRKPKLGQPTIDEETVLHATGLSLDALELVRDSLHDFAGDVDATVEYLCAIKYQHNVSIDPADAAAAAGPSALPPPPDPAAPDGSPQPDPPKPKRLTKRDKKRLKREKKRLAALGAKDPPPDVADNDSGDAVLDFGDIGV